METTFISIHDISLDARLLYVSQSIEDILGYQPHEVVGKSCWDYFHPDEIPFAKRLHGRSIQLDKAANLHYCQIKNKIGQWIGCECVFTVVYDVLIGCTSIYRKGAKSNKRAKDAPVIRQLFSSSPRDPRYHMLQYISSKFTQQIKPDLHEPRAALFLNRFSRTLTIMHATNGLADLLGINNEQLVGRSFYYCIQENCLREAVKCLESAKANDSIAYLRFRFRDPRQEDYRLDGDERMSDAHSSDEDDGGVHLADLMERDGSEQAVTTEGSSSLRSSVERDGRNGDSRSPDPNSRSSSGVSTDMEGSGQDGLFDRPENQQSRTSSISTPDESRASGHPPQSQSTLELEAVVSCTSDGLVVVLRRARPLVPQLANMPTEASTTPFQNGLFASPWASEPILPDLSGHPAPQHHNVPASHYPTTPTAAPLDNRVPGGPPTDMFMSAIRETAVFAWSLIGINGSLSQYCQGTPLGEAQPERLQVWDPKSNAGPEQSHYTETSHGQNSKGHNLNHRQTTADAVRHQTSYSYLTGLPDSGYYSGSEPMQIDSVTNGSSIDEPHHNGFSGSNQPYGPKPVPPGNWGPPSYS